MKPSIGGANIDILKFTWHVLMFTCHVREAREIEQNKINVSFTASEKSLDRNENSLKILLSSTKILLELSQSAAKFCSNYHGVPQNIVVAQTIGLAKYRREIIPNEISLIIVE